MARAFNFYLPGRDTGAKLTLPQRLSSSVDSFKEYTAFLVFLSAVLLPIALWPTKAGDLSHLASEPIHRLLGWTFLVSHFANRLNNYVVYGIAADAYVQNGKRVKYWTVPCTLTLYRMFQTKHWLMRCSSSRHDSCCLPCLLAQRSRPPQSHWHGQLESEGALSYPSATLYKTIPQLRHNDASHIRYD